MFNDNWISYAWLKTKKPLVRAYAFKSYKGLKNTLYTNKSIVQKWGRFQQIYKIFC